MARRVLLLLILFGWMGLKQGPRFWLCKDYVGLGFVLLALVLLFSDELSPAVKGIMAACGLVAAVLAERLGQAHSDSLGRGLLDTGEEGLVVILSLGIMAGMVLGLDALLVWPATSVLSRLLKSLSNRFPSASTLAVLGKHLELWSANARQSFTSFARAKTGKQWPRTALVATGCLVLYLLLDLGLARWTQWDSLKGGVRKEWLFFPLAVLLTTHRSIRPLLKVAFVAVIGVLFAFSAFESDSARLCQPFSVQFLRTIVSICLLALFHCLVQLVAGDGGRKRRLALMCAALAGCCIMMPILSSQISRPPECLEYVRGLRALGIQGIGEHGWKYDWKLECCDCWKRTDVQMAYAQLVLELAPQKPGGFSFSGYKITDPTVANFLLAGLLREKCYYNFFRQGLDLLKPLSPPERESWIQCMENELWAGNVPLKDGSIDALAGVLAWYPTPKVLEDMRLLLQLDPSPGVVSCYIGACYKVHHALSMEEVDYVLKLLVIPPYYSTECLAYLAAAAQNPAAARQLILSHYSNLGPGFFEKKNRPSLPDWVEQSFTPNQKGFSFSICDMWT